MSVILSHKLTLERLERLFTGRGLSAQIVEVEPAIPEQDLPRLAYLKVVSANDLPILIWVDTQVASVLRLRAVLLATEQPRDQDDPPIEPWIVERSAQQELFGLNASGAVRQMTLDHRLPYQGAIIADEVVEAAKNLRRTASSVWDISNIFDGNLWLSISD
ncbi:hypothetical protein [Thiorhodococcus fuscus]|uniref:CheW-like domain-containing protein n=1 Tax=Thiorhodococcus fuscus TaxID=527200 RepID=A0ABW4YDN0_9GAMM